jgi:hypothetical protein
LPCEIDGDRMKNPGKNETKRARDRELLTGFGRFEKNFCRSLDDNFTASYDCPLARFDKVFLSRLLVMVCGRIRNV